MRDPNVRALKYAPLYERLFDHSSEQANPLHFYNVLLLVAIVMCMAIDTSICERGFSLMNLLKTAKRSRMGTEVLRILMVVCSLGKDAGWSDPTKIPVDDIIELWREQSSHGLSNQFFSSLECESLLDSGDPTV